MPLMLLSAGVLHSRLRRSKEAKLVVFFSNCDSVDFHHALLQQPQPGGGESDSYETAAAAAGGEAGELLLGGCPVLKLHGDMKQPERTSSLVTFSKVRGSSTMLALGTLCKPHLSTLPVVCVTAGNGLNSCNGSMNFHAHPFGVTERELRDE
jgi:hypothetical protein